MREMTAQELEAYNNIMKSGSQKTGERIDSMIVYDTNWKERMIAEYIDLKNKYNSLILFFQSEDFDDKITIAENQRLNRQRSIMAEYLCVLKERMDAAGIVIPK